jgi:hypothetical protein
MDYWEFERLRDFFLLVLDLDCKITCRSFGRCEAVIHSRDVRIQDSKFRGHLIEMFPIRIPLELLDADIQSLRFRSQHSSDNTEAL